MVRAGQGDPSLAVEPTVGGQEFEMEVADRGDVGEEWLLTLEE